MKWSLVRWRKAKAVAAQDGLSVQSFQPQLSDGAQRQHTSSVCISSSVKQMGFKYSVGIRRLTRTESSLHPSSSWDGRAKMMSANSSFTISLSKSIFRRWKPMNMNSESTGKHFPTMLNINPQSGFLWRARRLSLSDNFVRQGREVRGRTTGFVFVDITRLFSVPMCLKQM